MANKRTDCYPVAPNGEKENFFHGCVNPNMKIIIGLLFLFSCSFLQTEEFRMSHPFERFLSDFVPQVAQKSTQLNKAVWLLEITGSTDAADLKADLDTELRI